MVDKLPISPGPGSNPLGTTQGASPAKTSKVSGTSTDSNAEAEGAPAFRALLDKLQEQAKSLQADSESLDKPEELSGAVDRAKSSLSDALSLSDKLLEAYRGAMQQDSAPKPDGAGSTGGDAN